MVSTFHKLHPLLTVYLDNMVIIRLVIVTDMDWVPQCKQAVCMGTRVILDNANIHLWRSGRKEVQYIGVSIYHADMEDGRHTRDS